MAIFFNIASLLTVCLLGWLYWMGITEQYLFIYNWYDIPLHLLGGLTAGLWASAVASRFNLPPRKALLWVVAVIIPVVIAWELFEYFGDFTRGEPDYWQDTAKDAMNGTIGSLVAWCVYTILYKIKNK